jgi:REP element-mobilizing transposase RayT
VLRRGLGQRVQPPVFLLIDVGQVGKPAADWQIGLPILENLPRSPRSLYADTFHCRRLPHFHSIGQPTFITWRLHGSLPANRSFPSVTTHGKAFVAMDRILDSGCTGPLYLRMPEIASMIVDAIHYRERNLRHYQLHAYVVMPNHVHLLITPLVPASRIMHSLKKGTAREGNRVLGLTGQPFWQDESYDRLVRDGMEFDRIKYYIENNPVKAGLAATAEEFLWSSGRPICQSAAGLLTCPTTGLLTCPTPGLTTRPT